VGAGLPVVWPCRIARRHGWAKLPLFFSLAGVARRMEASRRGRSDWRRRRDGNNTDRDLYCRGPSPCLVGASSKAGQGSSCSAVRAAGCWLGVRLAVYPRISTRLVRLIHLALSPIRLRLWSTSRRRSFLLLFLLSSPKSDCPHRLRPCPSSFSSLSFSFIVWPIRIPFIPLGSITLLRLHPR